MAHSGVEMLLFRSNDSVNDEGDPHAVRQMSQQCASDIIITSFLHFVVKPLKNKLYFSMRPRICIHISFL